MCLFIFFSWNNIILEQRKKDRSINKANKNNIGESWEISDVEGAISVVANGFLKGTSFISCLGADFNLVRNILYQSLFKLIASEVRCQTISDKIMFVLRN